MTESDRADETEYRVVQLIKAVTNFVGLHMLRVHSPLLSTQDSLHMQKFATPMYLPCCY